MIAHSPTPRWRVLLYALTILLAAGLTVGLVGCGGGADDQTAQQDEQQQQDEQDQQQQEDQESDESAQEEQGDEQTDDADTSDESDQPEETDESDTGDESDETTDLVDRGQMVAQNNGCLGCHSTDGSQMVGPTWQDAYGHEVTLQNGETVTVDDDYIRESIRDPSAKIVQGFSPSMPSYNESQISDDDVAALIAYIRSLSASADGNGDDE